ncbi:uncharacterized protein EAE97_004220 [Botrytis byssoidea]|uniref:Uncharacterized protein n=1 Tax=Botrytis byssoidea TaxID=139641 RepID=A0A9P5IM81_9HELO|nr:uncharacterized protein EAE97_004220 [Botrytis byssoidea]KAF7946971.1 hypothetical protein EAE97_004220 [Botrytis byssoidea]
MGGDLATKDSGKAIAPKPNGNPDVSFSQFKPSLKEDLGVIWNSVSDTTQQNEKERLQNLVTEPPSLEGLRSEAGKFEEVLQLCKPWITCSLAYLALTVAAGMMLSFGCRHG